jgi:hypothetical protein
MAVGIDDLAVAAKRVAARHPDWRIRGCQVCGDLCIATPGQAPMHPWCAENTTERGTST